VNAGPSQPKWIASWLASGLIVAQIVLLFVLGGGDSTWIRTAGFALWFLAAVFGWVPIVQLRRRGGVAAGESYVKTTLLVDSGLYAIVRHPQFVAGPLMSVALALVTQHPAVIVIGFAAVLFWWVDFRTVDARNIDKFGDEYRQYMDRVPGWNFVAGTWRWVVRRIGARRQHADRLP
jgi:protein-S-isoprenylcysteine O-methyltransferase Ste14